MLIIDQPEKEFSDQPSTGNKTNFRRANVAVLFFATSINYFDRKGHYGIEISAKNNCA
jgi:hypothetical protein